MPPYPLLIRTVAYSSVFLMHLYELLKMFQLIRSTVLAGYSKQNVTEAGEANFL